jgi:histidinol-phosphate aminotransferase
MNAETAFQHGGPDGGTPVRHDFSTNANACGPCPEVLAAVNRADATRYPDPRYTALREKLADFHGVDVARVVVAASASEFIFRVTAAFAQRGGRHVALPRHGYGDYARAARAWGLASTDGAQGIDDGAACAPTDAPSTLVWHCDPSSPLGQAMPALGERIDALAPAATCVLDLAYEPLRLDGHLGLGPTQLDRVWRLWTPNKALGLTGVRAGYAIAPLEGPDLSDVVGRLAPSWATGAHGVAMLDAWCDRPARDWVARSRDVLRGWRTRQQMLCADLGWTSRSTTANFLCVDPGVVDIAEWVEALRARRIKVRDATSFGLPDHVRLGVLAPEAQDALRDAVTSPSFSPRPASPPASRSRRPS